MLVRCNRRYRAKHHEELNARACRRRAASPGVAWREVYLAEHPCEYCGATNVEACLVFRYLGDEDVRKAMEAGVPIAIDTDAHSLFELDFMEYGVHTARRGWASKHMVLNALAYDGLLRYLEGQL